MTAVATRLDPALEKETQLLAWLRAQPSVLVGFSGGVDSVVSRVRRGRCARTGARARGDRPQRELSRRAVAMAREVAGALGAAGARGRPTSSPIRATPRIRPTAAISARRNCGTCSAPSRASAGSRRRRRHERRRSAATGVRANAPPRSTRVRSPLAELGFTKAEIRLFSERAAFPHGRSRRRRACRRGSRTGRR